MNDHIFTLPPVPAPLRVCQAVYGVQNVNDVRDAITNCFRRYCGYMSEWNDPAIYATLQWNFVQVLSDAGRNPNAVKLAISPDHFMPNPFFQFYRQTNGDKRRAYEMAVQEVLNKYPSNIVRESMLNIYIDFHSV